MKFETLHIRRPSKIAKKRQRSTWEEISHVLFRYRVEFTPPAVALALLWLEWAAHRLGHWYVLPLALLACAIACHFWGARIGLKRAKERWYAVALFTGGAAWATASALWPSPRWSLGLMLAAYPAAFWWMRKRQARNSVEVRIVRGLAPSLRRSHVQRAKNVVESWDGLTKASALSGSKVLSIKFDEWSVTMRVKLGHARVAEDFTRLRLRRLESAFDARRDSARVLPERDGSSRIAHVRFMLGDPLSGAVDPEELDRLDETGDDDLTLVIGRFEHGEPVMFDLVHTLIGGASGMGKSGVINSVMRGLAKKRKVAIFGVDLKPGGLELGRWEDVMAGLATRPDQARILFTKLIREIEYRGEIMRQRGIRKWVPTPEEPFIVLVIDEVQELKEHKLFPLIIRLSCLGRAYGFAMIMATQHPKDTQVPATAVANCLQRIGLKTETSTAERLIFDDNASKEGWRLTELRGDREGCFRIRSKRYREPNLARAAWVSDTEVERCVEVYRPFRTELDPGTQHVPVVGTDRVPLAPGTGGGTSSGTGGGTSGGTSAGTWHEDDDDGTVDAVIIEDDPEGMVLTAIAAGHGTPSQISRITGVPTRTVNDIIRRLARAGTIVQPKRRGPWHVAERVRVPEGANGS